MEAAWALAGVLMPEGAKTTVAPSFGMVTCACIYIRVYMRVNVFVHGVCVCVCMCLNVQEWAY
jgi:hypothetical protein